MKTDVYDEIGTTATRPRGGERTGYSQPNLDQEEMLKKMQAAGTPGAAHKALDAFAGDWKAEVKCWMESGQPAQRDPDQGKSELDSRGAFPRRSSTAK